MTGAVCYRQMKERHRFLRVGRAYRVEMAEYCSFCEKTLCRHCIRLPRNLNCTKTERPEKGNQSIFRRIRIYCPRASPTSMGTKTQTATRNAPIAAQIRWSRNVFTIIHSNLKRKAGEYRIYTPACSFTSYTFSS